MDDAQLLGRYAEVGSQAAFSELVGRYINLVHSTAMRQVGGDFHRAKDVVQLVFGNLAREAQSLSRHPCLIGWLYTSTSFVASNLIRTERRRQAREGEAYTMYNELLAKPEAEADWNQLRPALDGVMLELNESDRAAILWRFFDAQPLAVIGAKLGVSEDTARKRVERALEKMRGLLTKRNVASSTAALALMLANQAVIAAPAGLAESVTAAALTSVAGSGTSVFTFWKILGASKSIAGVSGILWIGGILGVLGIGAAAYELQTAQRAQASLAAATHDYESQLERLRALDLGIRKAGQNRATRGASAGAKPQGSDPFALGRKFLARFPRARALMMDIGIVDAARRNAPFVRAENLTPAQIQQFDALSAATWVANAVMMPTGIESGVLYPTEDQIGQVLGGQVAERYEKYIQIQYAYQITGRVAAALSAVGMPLSGTMADQLAQILENNSYLVLNNSVIDMNLATFGTFVNSVDWESVGPQAKAVLSPAQWEAAQGPLLHTRVLAAEIEARTQ